MTDEARSRWAGIRFRQDLAVEAHRAWVAGLPTGPPIEHRVAGEVIEPGAEPEAPPPIETRKAEPWRQDRPLPGSAKSLQKAADKAGYATLASWSYQERRGSHGRPLTPPAAEVCSILGERGHERFIADWEHVHSEKTDKWSWKTKGAMVWAPHLQVQPAMVGTSELKKEYFT